MSRDDGGSSMQPVTRSTGAEPGTGARARLASWASDRQNLVLAALVLLPAALVLVAGRHGLGMTPDSVGYVAAARSFATDWSFTYWDGTPLAHWPPGVPLILGILLRVGLDPVISAFVLNILASGALVVLAYRIGRQLLESPRLAILLAALASVALSTVHVYSELWSEPLFLVLCLTVVWLLTRMVREGASRAGVLAVVVCVCLACSLRFIGVALLPVVGLSMLLAEARRGLPRALALAVVVAAASTIGAAAVALRNLALVGSLTGTWSTSHATVGGLVRTTLATVGRWIVPEVRVGSTVAVIAGIAIAGAAAYGAFCLARDAGVRRHAVPLLAFVASYLVVLMVSELKVDGVIDERYLSPMLVPVSLLVVAASWNLWRRVAGPGPIALGDPEWRRRRPGGLAVGAVVVLVGGVYLAGNGAGSVGYAYRAGRAGYNSAQARSSPLARAAGSVSGMPGLLSNDPPHVYWAIARHPIPGMESLAKGGDAAGAVRAQIAAGKLTYFAEFKSPQTGQGVSADALRGWGVVLGDPVSYPDGTLYRMTVAPGR